MGIIICQYLNLSQLKTIIHQNPTLFLDLWVRVKKVGFLAYLYFLRQSQKVARVKKVIYLNVYYLIFCIYVSKYQTMQARLPLCS